MNLFELIFAPFRRSGCAATKEDLIQTEGALGRALGSYSRQIIERISAMENKLMSAIKDFTDRVNAAFTGIAASVDGIVADIDGLKKQIADLQNSSGTISPEDQAALDAIEAKANGIATKLAALDAATETPPTPPV